MAYPYGTQGAPVAGAGAPGLPSRPNSAGGDPSGAPVQFIVLRANTIYFTPDWATYARVTALGKGGQGLGGLYGAALGSTGAHGGAGAGLAATNIEQVSAGTPVNVNFDSGSALASFLNYQLSGGKGGDATAAAGGAPGVGSGGAVNYNGGAGETASSSSNGSGGGGAAGRGGNGVAGGVSLIICGGNSGPGDLYTTGGGAGGAGYSAGYGAAGLVRVDVSALGAATIGKSLQFLSKTNSNSATTSDGGDGGGGSGGSLSAAISNIPGAALVLVELW